MSENNENMKVYDRVRAVPPEALKAINGGRLKGMSDINPMWRIKMLTEVFGMCGFGWKAPIKTKWIERGEGVEQACFVEIELFVKVNGEWSEGITGIGGSAFVTMERNGPYTSDECFKMAYTDAISVACKSLGFAADVYFANDRTKYTNQEDKPTTSQRPVQTQQQQSNTNPSDADLNALEQASQANRTSQQQPQNGAAMKRVYALRERLNMTWPDLNVFAGNVLGREIKFLKSHVKTEEEWVQIENALKEAV